MTWAIDVGVSATACIKQHIPHRGISGKPDGVRFLSANISKVV